MFTVKCVDFLIKIVLSFVYSHMVLNRNTLNLIVLRSQSEVDLSRRSVRAWSPVRSVGSVLGMEAMASTDADLVLDPETEREVFRERETLDPEEPSWPQAASVWLCVEAGAVNVHPNFLPNW